MSARFQKYALFVLLGVLGLVVLRNWSAAPEIAVVLSDQTYKPLEVEDPKLRLDKLDQIKKQEYAGMFRDIFRATPPPPERPPEPVKQPVDPAKPQDTTPPAGQPLQIPFKFYGYSVEVNSGKKRAFFTNGEEIWIAQEGEAIQGKYKLLRIGNTTADFEEVGTGKKATLPFEQPPSS
ncbi:MAG: hypothetical protein HY046_03075 [Acidobacteria bacterium]|nr:hypothetical protein [Acidobacteriota bacterium]